MDADQTSEESENVPVIGEVSDDSVKADETEPTTLEEDAFQDNSVENTNLSTETDEKLESPIVEGNEEQPSTVETPEQETEESVENTVSEPVQTETEEISLNPEKEQKESDQNALKDKLVGYYKDLVASFSNFLSFLK